jgi:Zn-dependent M28 family amino/carboxypeptidase
MLPALSGDSIANGADDDGSGTVALLAIARATARQPSRRSTLFIWHAAEEKGLLGSAWFAQHPTVPMDSIVALLNVDMIGRNGSDSLFIIGPRAAPNGQSARLGAIIDSVNAASSRPFTVDRTADDANHPEMLYQRSDHIHYAKRGVPVAFFTTGLHADYHDVSDEASRINYPKLARVTDLLLSVGRALGNDSRRPR